MKKTFTDSEDHGKIILIGVALLIWALILFSFRTYGYNKTWSLWHVPAERQAFWDFRLIPGSAESFQHGFEPSIINPSDPAQRIFNYPAFWRLFFYSGLKMSDTIWVGICMNILFLIGVFLFPRKLSFLGAIAMLFVVFSPVSMLLYERGNVDLIVFFFCALIVTFEQNSTDFSVVLIVVGIIVKIYPFFGVTVFMDKTKDRFWKIFIGCIILLLVYMAATWNSMTASWTLTMRGDEISYGTNVFFNAYETPILQAFANSANLTWVVKNISLAIGVLLVILATVSALRKLDSADTVMGKNLAAFRMGASIYVGTFLLGNNWDYRLAFLVLVVPQLVEWTTSLNKRIGSVAVYSLVAIYISCWHFIAWYSPIITTHIERLTMLFILDELANWMLMVWLAYLLAVSAPDWMKEQVGTRLFRRSVLPVP
jgi:hypothetical protein